ncbi:hypothetical protein F5X97DRAFT_249940 [Nemania serpens]|nr:hypothetical protein F5X97DRAFT_249940 [Nemania serpens]
MRQASWLHRVVLCCVASRRIASHTWSVRLLAGPLVSFVSFVLSVRWVVRSLVSFFFPPIALWDKVSPPPNPPELLQPIPSCPTYPTGNLPYKVNTSPVGPIIFVRHSQQAMHLTNLGHTARHPTPRTGPLLLQSLPW